MSIELKLSPIFSPYTGNRRVIQVEANTLGACLDQLVRQFPRLKGVIFDRSGKLNRNVNIYLNNVNIWPDAGEVPVQDGDKLSILMLIAGG